MTQVRQKSRQLQAICKAPCFNDFVISFKVERSVASTPFFPAPAKNFLTPHICVYSPYKIATHKTKSQTEFGAGKSPAR